MSAATGFIFAEREVGTNGVGTAIELGRRVRVDGHEHYSEELRQFTCVGVPIFGVDQRLRGLLDVTCAADHDNKVIDFIAEQTAEKIGQRLLAQQSAGERALLDRFLAVSRRGRGDFFVISDQMLITSPRAAQMLDGTEQALLWEHISRLLSSSASVASDLDLPGGRQLVVRSEELHDGGASIGAIVEIREAPGMREPGCSRRRAQPQPLPGLVGSDPAWLRACGEVAAAVAHQVVVICGEPGVGKTAVAVAAHEHHGGGRLVIHDASTMSVDGPSWWMERLRAELDGEPGSVIIRHVDGLSPAAISGVTALLDAARAGGWRCLATAGLKIMHLPAGNEQQRVVVVVLPPLRNRIDDVPPLARHFAGSRRLAPDVMALLLRVAWPANTGALCAAIERAVATAQGTEVHVGDLPADLRANACRRRMSRFEQAELSAIMDAMSEARGNKKAAAALLGISRSTLYRKLEAAGLEIQ
ncbi:helix-turn-helix domain-containing protein [Pseudonocardia sp. 73-21]|uniref:helix-turn-helix domain-containing protein n=1 Tax=unclassified Pseudonocardia TaxID=2619320 RepID=UPI003449961A